MNAVVFTVSEELLTSVQLTAVQLCIQSAPPETEAQKPQT